MKDHAGEGALRYPSVIACLTGASVMVIELVAARLVAPYVGVSLYTWTGIIGVVLAGLAVGNLLGGSLADRMGSRGVLGIVLVLAGGASLGALAVGALDAVVPSSWSLPARVVTLAVPLFLPSAVLLGAIPPLVVELALRDSDRRGVTVGRVFGAGSVGSIAGTFLTGYALISWFGSRTIILGVAGLLIGLGCLFLGRRQLVGVGAPVLILLIAGVLVGRTRGPCDSESRYYCIRVVEMELDGEPARALLLDRLMHSLGYPDEPGRLYHDYERIFADAADQIAGRRPDFEVLQLGGGGYSFPRFIEARYPGARIDVVEIDPAVSRVASEQLGLTGTTRIITHHADARLFVNQEPARRYDLIAGDAFSDLAIPFHLTTVEYELRIRRWLAPGGLYLANVIDSSDGRFLRSLVTTTRAVFPHVYLIAKRQRAPRSARSTYVVVASERPLPESVSESTGLFGGRRVLAGADLDRWLEEGPALLLEDDHAPVDQMLAPLFVSSR